MVKKAIHAGTKGEKGQSLLEYGLILVLVAVVGVGGVTLFGNGVMNLYQTIVNRLFR